MILVANSEMLNTLDTTTTSLSLGKAFRKIYPTAPSAIITRLDRPFNYSPHNSGLYRRFPTAESTQPSTVRAHSKQMPPLPDHNPAHNTLDYIYTDGSKIEGQHTLGAALVDATSDTIYRLEVISDPVKHTVTYR